MVRLAFSSAHAARLRASAASARAMLSTIPASRNNFEKIADEIARHLVNLGEAPSLADAQHVAR